MLCDWKLTFVLATVALVYLLLAPSHLLILLPIILCCTCLALACLIKLASDNHITTVGHDMADSIKRILRCSASELVVFNFYNQGIFYTCTV